MSRGRRRQLGGVDRLPSGRWRVRLVDPGTGQRVSIGSYRTKAEAEVAFAAAITNQAKGAWVAPDKGRVTLIKAARDEPGSTVLPFRGGTTAATE